MLVLSRKKFETICIGSDITVQVVELRGDKVRIGIEAPLHIPVHRKEVRDANGYTPGRRQIDFKSNIAVDSEATRTSERSGSAVDQVAVSSSQPDDQRISPDRSSLAGAAA